MTTQAKLMYGLRRSPILANFQTIPRDLTTDGQYEMTRKYGSPFILMLSFHLPSS